MTNLEQLIEQRAAELTEQRRLLEERRRDTEAAIVAEYQARCDWMTGMLEEIGVERIHFDRPTRPTSSPILIVTFEVKGMVMFLRTGAHNSVHLMVGDRTRESFGTYWDRNPLFDVMTTELLRDSIVEVVAMALSEIDSGEVQEVA